ncbi:MAG: DUF2911 domain-containing protein [Verrucomicrobiota bacterium]|jgi:hypothetical protein
MNPGKLPFALVFASALALAGAMRAQTPAAPQPATPPIRFPELPPASPVCTNLQRVGLTDIKIVYSRPSKRHHAIFAGIVPYNTLWRTGDNASTKISFSTPVKLGGADGVDIPAGEYGLYTIPDEKAWTVILNKDAGLWGTDDYDPRKDVARFKVTPVKIDPPVETFTIDINDLQDDSATINLIWDRVRVPVKVDISIVSDLLVKIQASMDSPARKQPETYLRAATFYFDHTKDLTQALLWVNAGLLRPSPISYQLLYLKAKILAKQGDRDGAIAAANQSSQLAIQEEGPGTPYFKMNQEVIAGLH